MTAKPLFLISNDDGVHAPGVRALAKAVAHLGEVVIVAPHVERSASSHAISIHSPLRMEQVEPNVFAVEGTPADCVMLAIRKLLRRKPTWVLSGINRGANLGIDTIYSGTVGAAMEGTLHNIPSMAISTYGKERETLQYESACKIVKMLLEKADLLTQVTRTSLLNINVPNLPFEKLKGLVVTGLGRRIYDESIQEGTDPRGRSYFWIGAGGEMFEDIPDSDCVMIDQGYATVSVLRTSFLDEQGNGILQKEIGPAFNQYFNR
jgi:5'-nucleotidase